MELDHVPNADLQNLVATMRWHRLGSLIPQKPSSAVEAKVLSEDSETVTDTEDEETEAEEKQKLGVADESTGSHTPDVIDSDCDESYCTGGSVPSSSSGSLVGSNSPSDDAKRARACVRSSIEIVDINSSDFADESLPVSDAESSRVLSESDASDPSLLEASDLVEYSASEGSEDQLPSLSSLKAMRAELRRLTRLVQQKRQKLKRSKKNESESKSKHHVNPDWARIANKGTRLNVDEDSGMDEEHEAPSQTQSMQTPAAADSGLATTKPAEELKAEGSNDRTVIQPQEKSVEAGGEDGTRPMEAGPAMKSPKKAQAFKMTQCLSKTDPNLSSVRKAMSKMNVHLVHS